MVNGLLTFAYVVMEGAHSMIFFVYWVVEWVQGSLTFVYGVVEWIQEVRELLEVQAPVLVVICVLHQRVDAQRSVWDMAEGTV